MIDVHVINSTTMKFRVCNPNTRNMALQRGMWNLAGIPVVMSKWSPNLDETSPEVKCVPLWVHLRNIPLDMFSWKGLSFVTSAVGDPVRLHSDKAKCLDFTIAKVFVNADLTKELPQKMKFTSPEGRDALVEFSYPWLPTRCSVCNKWGHANTACLTKGESNIGVQGTTESPMKDMSATVENTIDTTQERELELPPVEILQQDSQEEKEEGEWSVVTPGKSRRSPGINKSLEFGQVSILSNSRFSVLSNDEPLDNDATEDNSMNEIEKEQNVVTEEVTASIEMEETVVNLDITEPPMEVTIVPDTQEDNDAPTRPALHRNAKDNKRVLSDHVTQRAKDANPSNLKKRSTRKNNLCQASSGMSVDSISLQNILL